MKRNQNTTAVRFTAAFVAATVAMTAGVPAGIQAQVRRSAAVSTEQKPTRVLEGRVTYDLRLGSDYEWVLRGDVVVAAPARLTVGDGARVVGDAIAGGALLVEPGAQVIVVGSGSIHTAVLTDVAPDVASQPAASVEEAPPSADETDAAPTAESAPLAASFVIGAATATDTAPAAPATVTPAPTVRFARRDTRALERSGAVAGDSTTATRASLARESELRSSTSLLDEAVAGGGKRDVPELGNVKRQIGPPTTVAGLDKPVRVIFGRFTSDVTLTNDTYWVLRGAVFIGAPATLTVQAGTRVVGELATTGTLVVERGAKIIADGTAAQPIVFTSDQPVGQRGRGDWGGLVINGNAPLNLAGGVGVGEGGTGIYGGNDPNDNSGVLRYVRVEFAGIEFSPDNELNGIAFQGVGRGTVVDHVQVHFNKDDGLEMFGGTVDIKHAIVTGSGDDSFDWTHGWQGRGQFWIVQQRGDDADRAIEADNLANNNEFLPRSMPTIYNITLVGDPDTNEGSQSTQGMELREGTAGHLRNFIVTGFKLQGFRVTGASSLAQVAAGNLTARHGISFGNGTNLHSSANTLVAASGGTINVVDPQLVRPFDHADPDFKPAATSPALTMGFETPPNDGFFDTTVTYRGALSADPAQDWTAGWTNYAQR